MRRKANLEKLFSSCHLLLSSVDVLSATESHLQWNRAFDCFARVPSYYQLTMRPTCDYCERVPCRFSAISSRIALPLTWIDLLDVLMSKKLFYPTKKLRVSGLYLCRHPTSAVENCCFWHSFPACGDSCLCPTRNLWCYCCCLACGCCSSHDAAALLLRCHFYSGESGAAKIST